MLVRGATKSKQAEARAELREEEQRRREAAEAESQLKNLVEYLETRHSFSLALKVATDKRLGATLRNPLAGHSRSALYLGTIF